MRAWRQLAAMAATAAMAIVASGCGHAAPPVVANTEAPENHDRDEEATVTPVADACAALDDALAEFEASGRGASGDGPGGEDHAYPPGCTPLDLGDLGALSPPWSRPQASCWITDTIYGPTSCAVQFGWGGVVDGVTVELDGAHAQPTVAIEERVIDGGRPEAIIRIRLDDDRAVLAVCRATPTLGCTAPQAIAGEGWTTRVRFEGDALVLDGDTGTPPDGELGRHPLVTGR